MFNVHFDICGCIMDKERIMKSIISFHVQECNFVFGHQRASLEHFSFVHLFIQNPFCQSHCLALKIVHLLQLCEFVVASDMGIIGSQSHEEMHQT